MKKLKILHIGNGNAFKIRAIIDYFKGRGHEIHFIPTPAGKDTWEGIRYHVLPPIHSFYKIQVLKNLRAVKRIVKDVKPDIVHAHNARGPGWYGAFSGHRPFVIHAYGSDILEYYYGPGSYFSKILTAYTLQRSDRIIVTGRHMVKGAGHLRVPEHKITVLPRGVNLNTFRAGLDTGDLRSRLKIGNALPVIFSPRYQINEALYNVDTIIGSISRVKKVYPQVLYIQLYDPSWENEKVAFEKMAEDLGVSGNYMLVKAVDNEEMPYFYNLADIVLSVTSTDGFPVTVLEASACETPIIATRLEYTKEWFVDGENGVLINERDHVVLSDAIINLYRNSSLMDKMKKANRKLVEERADYEKCMLELEKIYCDLVSKHEN